MFTIAISVGIGLIIGLLIFFVANLHIVYAIVLGLAGFIICQLLIGLWIRKKVNAVNKKIQDIMMDGQKKLNRKVQHFQQKPSGSVKSMQKALEKDQEKFIKASLEATSELEKFFNWNFLLKKQINTMRMQFYYQLGDMKKVDELLPTCMFMESFSVCVKLSRMYKNDDPNLDKFFQKKCKRAKADKAVLPYAVYSWILVKRGDVDAAIELLVKARKKTSNEVLKQNWEHLVNGRVKKFSNAGLGDEWFALKLETPKAKTQKRRF